VDTQQKAIQHSEGGLGIHLMRNYMDSIDYERKDDQNVLTMQKKVNYKL